MGSSESHLSLTFQWYIMTFTPPHQQIFIEISIFTHFFSMYTVSFLYTLFMVKATQNLFSFSSVFSFKQTKEQILFQMQPLKMFLKILGLKTKFSESCATQVGNSKRWYFRIWHNLASAQLFSQKNHSTLVYTFTSRWYDIIMYGNTAF